ncbi:MAG: aldo/keto reductase [Colwellia sp.]
MRLGLGTVQFGLDYGVTNQTGQVALEEIRDLLILAKNNQITVLDTAPAYGDAEENLGKLSLTQGMHLVTKIPKLAENEINIESYINKSLFNLKVNQLDAILFHQVEDIISAPFAELRFESLLKQKQLGRVSKVGVSVYQPEQLDFCLKHYPIDIVQLPLNVLDQRFIQGGWLNKLADKGVEVHCRSIFLQGLLLMDLKEIPDYFLPFKSYFERFIDTAKQLQVSVVSLALAVALQCKEVSRVLVGCCNTKQLQEIIKAYLVAVKLNDDLSHLACQDEQLLLPMNWQL